MQYAEAYLLALLGGNPSPTVDTIATILASNGIKCDRIQAQIVIDAYKGKTADQLIAEGVKNPLVSPPKPKVKKTKPAVSLFYST
jgi:ribosomal protein L12E/L44/L45/RPP1/RPP2